MALTFSNNLKTNVLDPLKALIVGEFSQSVYFDNQYVSRGSNWFNIKPVSDVLLEDLASGTTRTYTIMIQYYRMISGEYGKDSHIDTVSAIVERLKRLIRNISSYSSYWVNGRIESVAYDFDVADLSPELVLVESIFNAEVLEVI